MAINRERLNRLRCPARDTAKAYIFNYVESFPSALMRHRVAIQDFKTSTVLKRATKSGGTQNTLKTS